MISVYLDGELPSPWKEKLESHVSDCRECAERMEAYRSVSFGSAGAGEDAEGASDRVWQRLNASMKDGKRLSRRRAIWRRSVSLPIPAAAALIVLVTALALITAGPRTDGMSAVSLATETEFDLPASDMESVMEYLIGRSGSEVLMMRLPKYESFVSSGEPAIIRAADYSRQIASWQGRRRH